MANSLAYTLVEGWVIEANGVLDNPFSTTPQAEQLARAYGFIEIVLALWQDDLETFSLCFARPEMARAAHLEFAEAFCSATDTWYQLQRANPGLKA